MESWCAKNYFNTTSLVVEVSDRPHPTTLEIEKDPRLNAPIPPSPSHYGLTMEEGPGICPFFLWENGI